MAAHVTSGLVGDRTGFKSKEPLSAKEVFALSKAELHHYYRETVLLKDDDKHSKMHAFFGMLFGTGDLDNLSKVVKALADLEGFADTYLEYMNLQPRHFSYLFHYYPVEKREAFLSRADNALLVRVLKRVVETIANSDANLLFFEINILSKINLVRLNGVAHLLKEELTLSQQATFMGVGLPAYYIKPFLEHFLAKAEESDLKDLIPVLCRRDDPQEVLRALYETASPEKIKMLAPLLCEKLGQDRYEASFSYCLTRAGKKSLEPLMEYLISQGDDAYVLIKVPQWFGNPGKVFQFMRAFINSTPPERLLHLSKPLLERMGRGNYEQMMYCGSQEAHIRPLLPALIEFYCSLPRSYPPVEAWIKGALESESAYAYTHAPMVRAILTPSNCLEPEEATDLQKSLADNIFVKEVRGRLWWNLLTFPSKMQGELFWAAPPAERKRVVKLILARLEGIDLTHKTFAQCLKSMFYAMVDPDQASSPELTDIEKASCGKRLRVMCDLFYELAGPSLFEFIGKVGAVENARTDGGHKWLNALCYYDDPKKAIQGPMSYRTIKNSLEDASQNPEISSEHIEHTAAELTRVPALILALAVRSCTKADRDFTEQFFRFFSEEQVIAIGKGVHSDQCEFLISLLNPARGVMHHKLKLLLKHLSSRVKRDLFYQVKKIVEQKYGASHSVFDTISKLFAQVSSLKKICQEQLRALEAICRYNPTVGAKFQARIEKITSALGEHRPEEKEGSGASSSKAPDPKTIEQECTRLVTDLERDLAKFKEQVKKVNKKLVFLQCQLGLISSRTYQFVAHCEERGTISALLIKVNMLNEQVKAFFREIHKLGLGCESEEETGLDFSLSERFICELSVASLEKISSELTLKHVPDYGIYKDTDLVLLGVTLGLADEKEQQEKDKEDYLEKLKAYMIQPRLKAVWTYLHGQEIFSLRQLKKRYPAIKDYTKLAEHVLSGSAFASSSS